MFDYLGAAALYERAKDRFVEQVKDSMVEKMWNKVGIHYENYKFKEALSGLDELKL